jgi:putative hemolysin
MPEPVFAPAALGWILVVLFPVGVLFALLSALLERSGPIRLRHWAEEAGGRLLALFNAPARFVAFRFLLSVGGRVAPLLLFLALLDLLRHLPRLAYPGLVSLALVVALVIAIEAVNRALVHDPERALRVLTRVYRLVWWLLSPLVVLLAPLVPGEALERRERGLEEEEEDEASEEEIEAFIAVGTREGILEPEEGEMLWSIVGFSDTQVRSVMTPRIDVVCMPVDSTVVALADRFVESAHSRIPVYEDSIDHVVGILHIRDVTRALRNPEPTRVRDLIKPALFVPETKLLGELLKELQARFQQVAIVVDEYGGTAGLVTVEDLLEEIVGEIMDEHEALVAELVPLGDGAYRLDGRAHIELLDELYDLEIEDPEFETVAGLVFNALGRVPHEGESVDAHGLRFTVEALADRRIQTVRVERLEPPAQAAGEEAER